MKTLNHILVLSALFIFSATQPAFADAPLPEYILSAQSLIAQASTRAGELNDFADAVLIGQNYLRNAEAEYKNNLSWGKLEKNAEPTVRYYAAMAQLQASVILSRAAKVDQEKERVRLEGQAADLKAKIKVFDDKVAEIAALKADLAKRDATIADLDKQVVGKQSEMEKSAAAKKAEIEQLNAKIASLANDVSAKAALLATTETRGSDVSRELELKQKAISVLEQKVADLKKALESVKADNAKLQGDLASLAVQKGAVESQSQEQIQALNRAQQFVTEVGRLGGVIKTGADNITSIFTRASLIKASAKSVTVTPDGEKLGLALAGLLKNYQEYRAVIKVHGFGQPAKSEDATATDQMARLLREVAVGKGKLDPAAVEALGVGQSEPIYPKNNPEGNRRVEIAFVKKQVK